MRKPGSHRGAANIKKKKFVRGEKKIAIPLIDKVRDYILERKVELDELSLNGKYYTSWVKCEDLAKKFNCRIGEIERCINLLKHEKIVSDVSSRGKYFSILNIEKPEEEEREELVILFKDEKCPICGKDLNIENQLVVRFGLRRYYCVCDNKCFEYSLSEAATVHAITIFGNRSFIPRKLHKVLLNNELRKIHKEIKRWKTNERYLLKLLESE